jgi:predicted HTH domain antitoxin
MTLEIPDSALLALGGPDAGAEVRLAAAVMLYARHRLTAGKAAELAGMSKLTFLSKLGDYKVPVFEMTGEEVRKDAVAALAVSRRIRAAAGR